MALVTYADLITEVQNYMARTDSNVPWDDLVLLFEADASTRLRTHYQEVSTTITTVAGTASYALPADFLQAREVSLTSTDPNSVIDYATPAAIDRIWNWNEDTGQPVLYTIEGANIRFGPIPDAVYTLRLEYFQSITPLISGVNWLYQKFPSIYLFAALAEAELFLGADESDDRYQLFTGRRDDLYQKINRLDRKFKVGGAPLRMKLPYWCP